MIDLNFDLGEYPQEISEDIIALIDEILVEALNIHEMHGDFEISLSFVDDEEIRDTNKRFRNKDSKTDVLSFPMLTETEIAEIINKPESEKKVSLGLILLGDIIISVPTAKGASKRV